MKSSDETYYITFIYGIPQYNKAFVKSPVYVTEKSYCKKTIY